MSQNGTLGVRRSILTLQKEYEAGNKKPLEDVVRAWKGIQELPADDPRSFFILGGYHGEPFDLRPAVDDLSKMDKYEYWGGWCNHGNVLFPTWHRIYVLKLEEALQSIVPGVMIPFWDETDEYSLAHGIPSILTQPTFELDGVTIPNPLRSFKLPKDMNDEYWGDNIDGERSRYFKPKGYETVRYPLSGLVGNPTVRAETEAHNAIFPDDAANTELLNKNVITWLHGGNPIPNKPFPHVVENGIYESFRHCLRAPNFTVFSNTTSMKAWNNSRKEFVVALETPHNDIHVAVGRFDFPAPRDEDSTSGRICGANGDMGENNTAGLDPIFFFHHCNVDRMFWLWQKHNGHTDKLEVIKGYAGTDSSDSQGPTPMLAPGTVLNMKTPLYPFKHTDTAKDYISKDCFNIEKQLGYTYEPGSLEEKPEPLSLKAGHSAKTLVVSGMDRALFQGSFLVIAWATIDGAERYLGYHAVLSRFSVTQCANCRTHLQVVAHFPLRNLTEDEVSRATFRADFQHRGETLHPDLVIDVRVEG